MGKWVSQGYAPRNDPESLQARQKEAKLFRDYLPLILANSDRILGNHRYFFCQIGEAFLSSLWFFAGGPIPLGVLLLLWKKGGMIFECPACGGRVHAVGVCGSILSGCGSVWGPCLDCNQEQNLRRGDLGKTIVTIDPLLRTHRNEPVIRKGTQPRFDWKDGLVGESTPDEVIVPAIEAVPLNVLISEISGSAVPGVSGEARPMEPVQPCVTPLNLTKKRAN